MQSVRAKASQVCELMYEADANFAGQVCELISKINIRKLANQLFVCELLSKINIRKLANQLFVCELKCKMFDR